MSPRTSTGLRGILFSPLLHGNLEHIASNSFPILILGMMTFYFYKPIAWPVFWWIYFISGIWLWIGGRNNDEGTFLHIGASGLIYAFATFLFFSGVFRKHIPLMVVSALVLFLYGSMMWGIFPLKSEISWEAHLFGAIAGLLVAFNYRKEGPQRKVYEWENEEDDDSDPGEYSDEDILENAEGQNDIIINYHFVPRPLDPPEEKEETKKT